MIPVATQPAPRERPILFKGRLVRAILEGRKTQTRRVMREPYHGCLTGDCPHSVQPECDAALAALCPFGAPGGQLWVRETHRLSAGDGAPLYAADVSDYDRREKGPWRPSIFMPRRLSRIDLEITEVRVQRLQEITEEDARAEGVARATNIHGDEGWLGTSPDDVCADARTAFSELWDSINAERGFGWAANPWVWAITFRRVRP